MSLAPEIAGLKALAEARRLRVYMLDEGEIGISFGPDSIMTLERDRFDDQPDEARRQWLLKVEFAIKPGRLATKPDDMALRIATALTTVAAALLGEVAE